MMETSDYDRDYDRRMAAYNDNTNARIQAILLLVALAAVGALYIRLFTFAAGTLINLF